MKDVKTYEKQTPSFRQRGQFRLIIPIPIKRSTTEESSQQSISVPSCKITG